MPIGLTISALAVGIVALVLYMLQMILGSPKIKLDFDVREFEDIRVLECKIFNKPITGGLPRWLRIRRGVAEDIMAHFSIKELGSNKVIFPSVVPYIVSHTGVKNAQRISLAASPFPARFGIVTVIYSKRQVEVYEENVALPHGAYYVYVRIAANGEHIEAQKNFVVGNKHPFAYWGLG